MVEIDGDPHFTDEGRAYDEQRDRLMRQMGPDVLRFTTAEVRANLEGVVLAIDNGWCLRTQSALDAQWVPAGNLASGDIVFFGGEGKAVATDDSEWAYTEDEEVYDLAVEGAHSCLRSLRRAQPRLRHHRRSIGRWRI